MALPLSYTDPDMCGYSFYNSDGTAKQWDWMAISINKASR